jgi:hypothetical protein
VSTVLKRKNNDNNNNNNIIIVYYLFVLWKPFFYLGKTSGNNDEDGLYGIQIEHLEQKLPGGLCVYRDDQ